MSGEALDHAVYRAVLSAMSRPGIRCSDDSPQTMLHAAFALDRLGILPLHQAVNLVSRNPAEALGMASRTGSIEPGKAADLVLVEVAKGLVHVRRTFVEGTRGPCHALIRRTHRGVSAFPGAFTRTPRNARIG